MLAAPLISFAPEKIECELLTMYQYVVFYSLLNSIMYTNNLDGETDNLVTSTDKFGNTFVQQIFLSATRPISLAFYLLASFIQTCSSILCLLARRAHFVPRSMGSQETEGLTRREPRLNCCPKKE